MCLRLIVCAAAPHLHPHPHMHMHIQARYVFLARTISYLDIALLLRLPHLLRLLINLAQSPSPTAPMAPVRSTRSSRLPQSPFSCTANRIRKRPASPISPLMSQQPPASRRSAFTYFPAQLIHDDNDDEDDADDSRHVYFPRNKRELFTRHIFPVSHASVEPGPLEGPEIDYAAFAFAEHDPALRVQYHAGLVPLLFKEAARIAERPEGSCFVSQTLAKRYESELAHSSEAMWEGEAVVRKVDMEAFRARKLGTSFDLEQELCRAANQHLVDPINAFCEESDNFEDMPPAFAWTGWQWADFDDHLGGLPTEWVGRYRGNTRAACRWKMGVTDEDMESLLAAGSGNVPPTWAHALHPGFYFSRAEGEDTPRSTDDRVTESAAKACVLVSV